MSSPMIAWVPMVNGIYRYFTSTTTRSSQAIQLPSVEIHDIETDPEKRPRTLKHLIKANHINFSILYNNLHFQNHMPHAMGAAYFMGASPEHLNEIYDHQAKELLPWKDSPSEITVSDWREFLGKKVYQRAYVDFFEDELALKFGYKWQSVIQEYLYSGKKPLFNSLVADLGHSLIHLGYAYELQSRELAIESLAMLSTSYNYLAKYSDDPIYTVPPPPTSFSSTSPLAILRKISQDTRFDGIFKSHSVHNMDRLFATHEALVLEYWNAWTITDPVKQFQESQEAAVMLLVGTAPVGTHGFDFFLCHTLTTSHAIRILLPFIPQTHHMNLVRQWWLLVVSSYISQLRPAVDQERIGRPDLGGRHWKYVEDKALNGPWCMDSHYVKALRAMREAALTWGDVHEWYLTAAIHFADEFGGWTGWAPGEQLI